MVKKSAVVLACIMLSSLLSTGCTQQDDRPHRQEPHFSTPKITIGLLPELDVFAQKKSYEPLLTYLSQKIGVSINIQVLPRYGNVIDNFHELGLDGAFFGSYTGAMAIRKLGVEPLARPQYSNGTSTYYGMVFVKKGSGIRTARDMQGKRMVFVDQATTAGFLLPLNYFQSIGIADYRTWFSEYYFSGTHEDAIYDVLNGSADIGASKSTIFYTLATKDKRVSNELEIIATSPHVPANGLAVRSDLDESLKNVLKQQLLAMNESVQGREILNGMQIEKFIPTMVEDYRPVFEYACNVDPGLGSCKQLNN